MTDRMLFDNKERVETRPSNGNENTFDYFNNSGRKEIIPVREVMENWFRMYPDSEKEEMKKRVKADFGPAFYELGMYCYFKNMGYDIFIHPTVPNSSKRPDFLVVKNDHDFYVEIKEMRMLSDAERLKERRLNTLTDSMNLVDCTYFMLCIESIRFKSGNQPSGKKIIKHFDDLIETYDPDVYREMLEKEGFRFMPELKYDDNDVSIKVKLMPKAPHLRGKRGRSIASYGAYTKIGGDEEMIKSAIQTKATRYGELDMPFLICLNYPSNLLHKEDINIALYGNDGIFGAENNPRNTRMSAVLITTFTVSGLLNTNLYYHENPFAKNKIDFLPFTDLIKGLNLTDRYVQEFGSEL
ncbi:hypothetical protein ACFU8T_07715 [Sphingobacterium spiritivorum]|uniref:Uncharacterized protein n=1 Tax=Sphingobacterium spiritivorum ATCC 33861 TaxID=525373 RepID=D7VTE0_SPHSI|nr:hypothetical protein [Sphingobacterium spiritivorum]EFK57041.1 hypothetical protein HMPREF0766_14244 [Sphingobacterium spiritivorum ATCC 33861]QQT34954.1 hypothetical protein I6J01_16885 [Sphingobacterium spiritivorum]WQD35849.1 hypothetical protein U0038_08830 [Sphingobacterium spiritivorum]SUJ02834.1 Uncharacterised protein [Sphingobacterium spiritivorum]